MKDTKSYWLVFSYVCILKNKQRVEVGNLQNESSARARNLNLAPNLSTLQTIANIFSKLFSDSRLESKFVRFSQVKVWAQKLKSSKNSGEKSNFPFVQTKRTVRHALRTYKVQNNKTSKFFVNENLFLTSYSFFFQVYSSHILWHGKHKRQKIQSKFVYLLKKITFF